MLFNFFFFFFKKKKITVRCPMVRARIYYQRVPGSQVEIPLIRHLKEKDTPCATLSNPCRLPWASRSLSQAAGRRPTRTWMRPGPPLTEPPADRAGQYAAGSLKVAQDARAALDAELKAQEGKWFKSYDKTKELAVAAKAAGDKAAADAVAGKEKAEAVAAKEKADAAARAKARVAPLRIGGKIHAPTKIKDVKPVYPAIAQLGACRRRGHDRSDDWTRRESHRREGRALDPDARSGRA